MATVTADLGSMTFAWVGYLTPIWLGDDDITTGIAPCYCGNWGFPEVCLRVKCPLLLCDMNKNQNLSINVSKISQYKIS
jgi:hypothetical protein